MRHALQIALILTFSAMAIADEVDPPTPADPSPPSIAELVAALDGLNLRACLEAVDELTRIGPDALPELRRAAARPRTREQLARIHAVAADIRIRSNEAPFPEQVPDEVPWSEPVAGIRMRLFTDAAQFVPGQPIRLRLDFQNVADEPRPFVPIVNIDARTPAGEANTGGQLQMAITRADAPARLPPRPAQAGRGRPVDRDALPSLAPGEVATWRLRTGENLSFQHRIILMHDVGNRQRAGVPPPLERQLAWPSTPGRYILTATYRAQRLLGADEDIAASIEFEVVGPAAR